MTRNLFYDQEEEMIKNDEKSNEIYRSSIKNVKINKFRLESFNQQQQIKIRISTETMNSFQRREEEINQ